MEEQTTNPYQVNPVSDEAPAPADGGQVSGKTREFFGKAAPWIRFMAVMGFIGSGLMVFLSLFMVAQGGNFGQVGMAVGPVTALIYLAVAVVMFFPSLILSRLSTSAKRYRTDGQPVDLEAIARSVFSFSRFYGVFTIVVLGLYLVIIVVVIILSAVNGVNSIDYSQF